MRYNIVIKYDHAGRTQTGQISFGGKNRIRFDNLS